MPVFKAAVNQADRHKTKGNWILTNRPNNCTSGGSRTHVRCRFFELPAELRVRIYELVFTPSTTVVLCSKEAVIQRSNSDKRLEKLLPSRATIFYDWERGQRSRSLRKPTKWRSSLSGIIYASRQAYQEAAPLLYERTGFFFCGVKPARAYLKAAGQPNCKSIRKMQLYHSTWGHGSSLDARLAKDKADASFVRLCKQFATALPNLTSLDVTVAVLEVPDGIVPAFKDPAETISIRQMSGLSWVQALKAFAALNKLTEVSVKVSDWWGIHRSSGGRRQPIQMYSKLCKYRKSLYKSMGEAVRRLILGFEGEVVWEEHVARLEEYRAFCWDPLAPTTATMADPRYAAFLEKYVKKRL